MNQLIKADNLEALKSMEDNCIDLIYIDPPYFFHSSRKGAFNYDSDFTREQWTQLMMPRLTEAKRVLNDTGIIFVSINEDGQAYLKLFMDEVFGTANFVENFIWVNINAGKNNTLTTSNIHEYILCYAKSLNLIKTLKYFTKEKPGAKEILSIFNNGKLNNRTNLQIQKDILKYFKENTHLKGITNYFNVDNKAPYRKSPLSAPTKNKKTYDLLHPITQKPCKVPSRGWGFTQESMQKLVDEDRICFGETEEIIPTSKTYITEVMTEPVRSLLEDSSSGKLDLLELFDEAPFAFPKPVSLIKTLIAMHPRKDIKVLDFFAGSGTTGHAVMELNKEDGGIRSFILVEQMDYAETITWERLKRAKAKYDYTDSLEFINLEEASDE